MCFFHSKRNTATFYHGNEGSTEGTIKGFGSLRLVLATFLTILESLASKVQATKLKMLKDCFQLSIMLTLIFPIDANVIHLVNNSSTPARIDNILRWKCSGVDEMPKGIRLKQYRLNGVLNVSDVTSPLLMGFAKILNLHPTS